MSNFILFEDSALINIEEIACVLPTKFKTGYDIYLKNGIKYHLDITSNDDYLTLLKIIEESDLC